MRYKNIKIRLGQAGIGSCLERAAVTGSLSYDSAVPGHITGRSRVLRSLPDGKSNGPRAVVHDCFNAAKEIGPFSGEFFYPFIDPPGRFRVETDTCHQEEITCC